MTGSSIDARGRFIRGVLVMLLLFVLTVTTSLAGEIDFVDVGDPGNSPGFTVANKYETDAYGNIIAVPVTVGAVPYAFRIAKFELTRAQYIEFLNTVDPDGTNVRKLWDEAHAAFVGILRNAAAPTGKKYYLDNAANANLPSLVPSWYAAARFCNWLHNNRGGPPSTESDETSGAYDTRFFDDDDIANDSRGHNLSAKYWIPTESEWVKACYYKGGGLNAGFWTGPNRTNADPAPGFPPGGANSANISSSSVPVPGKPLPVGSYPNSFSPYGAYDMAGNENEWTETWFEGDNNTPPDTVLLTRGGHYRWLGDHSRIWYRYSTHRKLPRDWRNSLRLAALPLPPNTAPVINTWDPLSPFTMVAGSSRVFSVDALDADGDALIYSWRIDGAAVLVTASVLNYSPTAADAGSHTIQVTVSDGRGGTASQVWSVTVTALAATPPSITTQPANQSVNAGQTATFSVLATGTEPLAYQWRKNGANIAGANASSYTTLAAIASDNGALFSVVVSNAAGSVTSATATLFVNVPNIAPVANAGADQSVEPGTASLDGSASSDPDNGPSAMTYAWTQVSGPATVGITNANKALASVSLSVLGDYVFRLTVSDGVASSSDTVTLSVIDSTPPVVNTTSVVLKGSADGTGSGIASVTVNGSPAAVSGTTWQKEVTISAGNNVFTVTVTDGSGQQASQTVQVTK